MPRSGRLAERTVDHDLAMEPIRNDWTVAEVEAIFATPLLDLIARAGAVHRAHHDPHEVRVDQLISIKTGGCPELRSSPARTT